MPDLTSTLLAMYQQIIGGSNAREQSALEAEAARRVILSGLTINPSGVLTLTNTVVVGGSIQLAGLQVTGNALVNGTLTTGALAVVGDVTIGGVLTVNGFGAHSFIGAGAGSHRIGIRNTQAGVGNATALWLGTDLTMPHTYLQCFSSTFTGVAPNLADGAALSSVGAGGLSMGVLHVSGVFRVYTGGSVERFRITATGEVCVNTQTLVTGRLNLVDDQSHAGLAIQNSSAGNNLTFVAFYNSASVLAGYIQQGGATSVLYNTTSDARLKQDRGPATDVSALRAVVVHDFAWTADDRHDRGVFAQEAAAVFPRAITAGTDERTSGGDLARPWMTDYSKFVPDLIVGWQQHAAALAALAAKIDAVARAGHQVVTYGDQHPEGERPAGNEAHRHREE